MELRQDKENGKNSRWILVLFEGKPIKEEEPGRYLPGLLWKKYYCLFREVFGFYGFSIDRVCVPSLEKL